MRKRRTREHMIADLSVNHFQRFILLSGHVPETLTTDYGYDVAFFTHDTNGEPEDGLLLVQLKATDTIQWRQDSLSAAFVLERRDVERWCSEIMPVILVLYDAPEDTAYWLYIQAYFRDNSAPLQDVPKSVTVSIPRANRVNIDAIEQMRQYKARLLQQAQGAIRHES
jgi:hypothetical protein